ncbi:MAG: hypothetical protein SGI71_07200 [Verrucomicrobiota bacterium]|nr:hypothetical protein [Verrucomicrobiota bacterium]
MVRSTHFLRFWFYDASGAGAAGAAVHLYNVKGEVEDAAISVTGGDD